MAETSAHDVTGALVDWATGVDGKEFPAEAFRRAADAITDGMGCMVAGSREPLASKVRAVLSVTGDGGARLVGHPARTTPADAALYNGTLAHALDYDDTTHPAYAHPTAVLLPVILALAPRGIIGHEALTAYVLGLEVFGKLGRALNRGHYQHGWHATSTFGSIAATVTAARLLRLPPDQFRMALGIGASAASGLRVNFGTMTKPLHAGYAARNGVLAALLAEQGFTAGAESLDHRFGYAQVFARAGRVDGDVLRTWGRPLEILSDYGIALKPYPSCGATHPGIEAALLLAEETRVAPADVTAIRAGVCEMALEPLLYAMPRTPLEGKFSLHFCLAVALARRRVGLSSFCEETVAAPEIRALIERTTMEVDERVRRDSEFATVVTVTTRDGATHERLVPLAKGKPARWMSRAEIEAKYRDCVGGTLGAAASDELFSLLQTLPALPDLGRVVELAAGARC